LQVPIKERKSNIPYSRAHNLLWGNTVPPKALKSQFSEATMQAARGFYQKHDAMHRDAGFIPAAWAQASMAPVAAF
jgi:hypothetical protein